MFDLSFLIFNVVIITTVFAQPESLTTNAIWEIKEYAEEYVRLHLVHELSKADDMMETSNGILWLRAWAKKRCLILDKVVHSQFYRFRNDWQIRLQYFQKYEDEYLKNIIFNYYDKHRESSPWPKISFDYSSSQTIWHPEQTKKPDENERHIANPYVTDDDVDQVLRFHRPLNEEETKIISKKARSNDKTDRQLYYFINPKKIDKLKSIYYELLKKSFNGKRASYLDYQAALFHAERITAQLNLLTLNKFSKHLHTPDDHLYKKMLPQEKVLKYDAFYKKYLNFDNIFFEGNMFFGRKNRYDEPANF